MSQMLGVARGMRREGKGLCEEGERGVGGGRGRGGSVWREGEERECVEGRG